MFKKKQEIEISFFLKVFWSKSCVGGVNVIYMTLTMFLQ